MQLAVAIVALAVLALVLFAIVERARGREAVADAEAIVDRAHRRVALLSDRLEEIGHHAADVAPVVNEPRSVRPGPPPSPATPAP